MENQKLKSLMSAKGISKTTLSKITGISSSTLSRIIGGEIKHVKIHQMEAISQALGTSVHAVFDIPQEHNLGGRIRPDEAGLAVTKLLHSDESFLLFWYQNSSDERRRIIFECAHNEYNRTLLEVQNRAAGTSAEPKEDQQYEQLSLFHS